MKTKKETKVGRFCRRHKTVINSAIVVCTGIGLACLAYNLLERTDDIEELPVINEVGTELPMWEEIQICSHIRRLPRGYMASEGKRLTAEANGFCLADNETWVKSYSR